MNSEPANQKSDLADKTVFLSGGAREEFSYAPGDTVGDSYILLDVLARGGMGVLFRARHIQLDKVFALKLLPPTQITTTNWKRFEIEGRALAKLEHPNVVQIFNMGVDRKGCPFYVMELLQGKAMSDYLDDDELLSLPQFLRSFSDVCAALELAHGKGIVHRDIKPSNLILESGDGAIKRTKVVDFGIALLVGQGSTNQGLTRAGEVFGSPAYMSPEQTTGTTVTFASDIYSLGCTMYSALMGSPPFRGATAVDTMIMHQNASMPLVVREDFTADQLELVNDLIAGCTEKRPQNRFESVAAVREAVNEIAGLTGSQTDISQRSKSSKSRSPNSSPADISFSETYEESENDKPRILLFTGLAMAISLIVVAAIFALQFLPSEKSSKSALTTRIVEERPTIALMDSISEKSIPTLEESSSVPQEFVDSKKPISEVLRENGKAIRIFHFPKSTRIGDLGGNSTFGASAKGDIKLDNLVPMHFSAAGCLATFPQIYNRFDNEALFELSVKNTETPPAVSTLARWKNLYALGFYDCDLSPTFVKDLGKLHLTSLRFQHSKFDPGALAAGGVLKGLNVLKVVNCEDVSKLIDALPEGKKLQILHLRSVDLKGDDIRSLAKLTALRELDLRSASISDEAFADLSRLPRIGHLAISLARYNPRLVTTLCASKSIDSLVMSNEKLTEADRQTLSRRFRHLTIDKFSGI